MIVTLKDGSKKEYAEAKSVIDIAYDISEGLARAACAGEVNGEVVDLRTVIDSDCELNILTAKDEKGLAVLRHTASHVLAQAVQTLFPDAKVAIGPSIDTGFYYDFDCPPFSRDDLDAIEKEMKKIVKQSLPLEVFEVTKEKALDYMKERQEDYKVEMIEELPEGETITFYKQGDYEEFCAGPHVSNTCVIKAIKLLSTAGAYWRGDEKNKMLTRIYGISFPKAAELKDYLNMLEEAKKRDHRKLGKELGLFTIMEEGPGFPFFLPKGMILKNTLIDYWRKMHTREGYEEISTPILLNRQLWETSGHWDHYRENMYTTVIDDMDFAVKPMNCPGGMLVYKMEPRSYKELPLRLGELGLVHRHEKSGVLHGLLRVRQFTQDDAHIICAPEQLEDEIIGVIALVRDLMALFGFQYRVVISTKPAKAIGSDEAWELATNALIKAVERANLSYTINAGDGAFYGPKIDVKVTDAIGREWQLSTIQCDFTLPERFELEYVGQDGERHRPVMVHRAILGSLERFIGVLTEHYAGAFPTWLAPVQAKILTVTDAQNAFAEEACEALMKQGIRAEVDTRNEKLGFKVREAQLAKIPYILVVGDKEVEARSVNVRLRTGENLGVKSLDEVAALVQEDCAEPFKRGGMSYRFS